MDARCALLIEELLGCLDDQARLLELKVDQLDKLYAAMIDRDETAIENVLEEMERTQQRQELADAVLARLREALAEQFQVPQDRLRLSQLINMIPPRQAQVVRQRRARIVDLAEQLRRRHLLTVTLLNECSQINRMLLEALVPSGGSVVTYGADGAGTWSAGIGTVDTET